MNFDHENGQPIGSQMPLYQSMLEEIKTATAHLSPPEPGSSCLEGVDLMSYEVSLDLGQPYYILFPKNPDTHKVLSRMHARRMPDFSKALLHPWLGKLSQNFRCFSLEYGDGYSGYDDIGMIGTTANTMRRTMTTPTIMIGTRDLTSQHAARMIAACAATATISPALIEKNKKNITPPPPSLQLNLPSY